MDDPHKRERSFAGSGTGLLVSVNARILWRRLDAIRRQSRLFTGLMALFILCYLGMAFGLFYWGLHFLATFPGLGSILTERLIYLLFAFLFVLLIFSNLIISYTNLFKSRETTFLMSLPISSTDIFRWKYLESTMLASWAFIFLVAPMLAAYGISRHLPLTFYLITAVLMILFIFLPGIAGIWLAIAFARLMDRRSFQIGGLAVAVIGLVALGIWAAPDAEQLSDTRTLAVMERLLHRTQFAQFPFIPSYWVSSTLLQWEEGAYKSAVFFALVLISYVLFFGYITTQVAGKIFVNAFSTVQGRGALMAWNLGRKGYKRPILDRWFEILPFGPDVRALIVKDIRMFWRDTTQWGQTLVLFGLLGVYILNLRQFSQQMTNMFWIELVSLLNLTACALNLATLTTRFVFPQFSLEGRRLWIMGMAPIGLPKALRVKYGMSSVAALMVTVPLIFLSCAMLKMEIGRTIYFAASMAIMTFSMTGLAMGCGALFPNFREENPGKIVSGFGGTFCLVMSFIYILSSVLAIAIMNRQWIENGHWTGLVAGAAFLAASVVAGFLPMILASRKLQSAPIEMFADK